MNTHTHMHTHACTHTCAHTHTHACTHRHARCTHTHIYTCTGAGPQHYYHRGHAPAGRPLLAEPCHHQEAHRELDRARVPGARRRGPQAIPIPGLIHTHERPLPCVDCSCPRSSRVWRWDAAGMGEGWLGRLPGGGSRLLPILTGTQLILMLMLMLMLTHANASPIPRGLCGHAGLPLIPTAAPQARAILPAPPPRCCHVLPCGRPHQL